MESIPAELSAETLIALFRPDAENSTQTNHTIADVLKRLALVPSQSQISTFLGARVIKKADQEGRLGDYLCALLAAFNELPRESVKTIRFHIFNKCAIFFQQGKFSENEGKSLLEYLGSSSYFLEEAECKLICQRALDKALLTQDSTEHLFGLNCNLELCLKLATTRASLDPMNPFQTMTSSSLKLAVSDIYCIVLCHGYLSVTWLSYLLQIGALESQCRSSSIVSYNTASIILIYPPLQHKLY